MVFKSIFAIIYASSGLFIALALTFFLFRTIALNAYVKYKVAPSIKEAMPSLSNSESLEKAFYAQIEPFLLGLSSDIIVAVILALLLYRLNKHLQKLLIISIGIFLAANLEHIVVNSAHISLGLMPAGLDPTFIKAELDLALLKKAILLISVGMLSFLLVRFAWVKLTCAVMLIPLFLTSIVFTNSTAFSYPTWLSTNPIFNIRLTQPLIVNDASPPNEALAPTLTNKGVSPELNVLIIYIEGVSKKSIRKPGMINLEKLSKQNISFSNYYARQIITANGLYASLTGYVPSFLERYSKWDALTPDSSESKNTLPRALAEHGYHTAFLQSAPLHYMNKDEKLNFLGYKDIYGDSHWDKDAAFSHNSWGIDDRSFYFNILKYMDTLDTTKPWFISALTTSTHSPYNVPENAKATREDALRFADEALDEFVNILKSKGVLKNTLLIITSDEGRETSDTPGLFNSLPQNRLPLVMIHPSLEATSLAQPLLNTDLPNIVLQSISSNSVKQMNDNLPKHKHLVFGNFITQRIYWHDLQEETVTACNFEFVCQQLTGVNDLSKLNVKNSITMSMPKFNKMIMDNEN